MSARKDLFQRILAGLALVGIFVGTWLLYQLPDPVYIRTPAPCPHSKRSSRRQRRGMPFNRHQEVCRRRIKGLAFLQDIQSDMEIDQYRRLSGHVVYPARDGLESNRPSKS